MTDCASTLNSMLAPKGDLWIGIVGASARAAAMSAQRSGLQLATADLFADADLQQLCPATRVVEYPESLIEWLVGSDCDAWMYVGALENHPHLVERLAAIRPLLGNGSDVLHAVRDPLRLQRALADAGLRFPETRVVDGRSPPGNDWLHKTCDGASGSGVSRHHQVENLLTRGYWQRMVQGEAASAVFVGNGKAAQLCGVSTQLVGESWTGAAPFQYCGSIAPLEMPGRMLDSVQRIGEAVANAFGIVGVFGVDLVIDGDEPCVIEVNPRFPASAELFERLGSASIVATHVTACRTGCLPELAAEANSMRQFVGKAILFAERELLIDASSSQLLLDQREDPLQPALADIPTAGTQISPGQPVLTLFVEAASHAGVQSELRRRLNRVQDMLYHSAGESTQL